MLKLLLAAATLLASAALTAAVRVVAAKGILMDIPNRRSSHTVPTPRGGGLAITGTFLASLATLYACGVAGFPEFIALLGGGSMVAAVGLWDDHTGHVAPRWRLAVHGAAALWAVLWLGGAPGIPFGSYQFVPDALGYLAGGLFLVCLLNLFNFMDGIDGLAAGEALFTSLAAAVLLVVFSDGGGAQADAFFWELILLSSATLGFLLWNWPPARIFMGDVGSGFLGFTLGVFALATAGAGVSNIWVWLILLGVFCVDASLTLARRMLTGQRWYEAHRSHAYQVAARRFASHKKVTLGVWLLNLLWLLPWAFCAQRWPQAGALCLIAAYLPLLALALRFDAGKA